MVWVRDEERGSGNGDSNENEPRGGRRRPKKRWSDTIESDARVAGVCVGDVEDRDTSRGLGQVRPTPDSWEGEREEKQE